MYLNTPFSIWNVWFAPRPSNFFYFKRFCWYQRSHPLPKSLLISDHSLISFVLQRLNKSSGAPVYPKVSLLVQSLPFSFLQCGFISWLAVSCTIPYNVNDRLYLGNFIPYPEISQLIFFFWFTWTLLESHFYLPAFLLKCPYTSGRLLVAYIVTGRLRLKSNNWISRLYKED